MLYSVDRSTISDAANSTEDVSISKTSYLIYHIYYYPLFLRLCLILYMLYYINVLVIIIKIFNYNP